MKKTYQERLLDPRWQKKRLAILNRDKWACRLCRNKEKTLHVHHLHYNPGKNPWDYPKKSLITLCCDCHTEQTQNSKIDRLCELIFDKSESTKGGYSGTITGKQIDLWNFFATLSRFPFIRAGVDFEIRPDHVCRVFANLAVRFEFELKHLRK